MADAREQGLITQEEYQEYSLRSHQQYLAAMAEANTGYHGNALSQTGTFFGDMATAFATGNEKMLKISESFAKAEAVINAIRAYAQVAADPSLPWFAKIPAAVSVMGSVMSMANSLKGGVSGGSGGSSSATTSAAGSSEGPMQFNINTISAGGSEYVALSDVSSLLDAMSDAAGDSGFTLLGSVS